MNVPDSTLSNRNALFQPDTHVGCYTNIQAIRRLVEVVQELSLAHTLAAIMAIVRVAARELTKADGASFVLRDEDQCFYADEDSIAPLWKGQRFPIKICISGWTMTHRQPVIISDIYSDERIPFAAYQPTFVKSLAMVPIRTLNPVGAIGVYWAQSHQPTPEEVSVLQALADTTAVAIENVRVYSELEERVQKRTADLEFANARLREEIQERQAAEATVRQLSITDELTGLNNRRGFLLLAEQQLKLAQRINQSVCLLFIDLDGLKKVNDSLGHEMGDRLIVNAGQLLQATFRESDVVARLGGDEFAVFVSACAASDNIIERLLTNIEQFNQREQSTYQLSMSIGLAICHTNCNTSLDDMMKEADELMYAQKRTKQMEQQ